MKKTLLVISLLSLILFILINGCKTEYEKQYEKSQQEINNFCKNLILEDYYWDCSKWHEINFSKLPTRYTITCTFGSKSFDIYSGCDIDFYLTKEGRKEIYIHDVEVCEANTLKEALDYCEKRLPEELKNIKIIEPIEEVKP